MLKIEKMTCGYASGFALEKISLEVKKGEMIGIIGPNGSGKTTLLKSITRLMKLRKGAILFNKKDINYFSPKELARFTQCQTARPAEVQGLIEELLQQLPEQERQEFKMKIRTEAMI